MNVEEKVLEYIMAIIDYKKSILCIALKIVINVFILDAAISNKYEFNTTSFSVDTKFQKLWTFVSQNWYYGTWVLFPLQSSNTL